MTPKLSVIIPVHNGEKKIKRTAQQILEQDYSDLELLLVENGSDDNTYKVCQDIAAIDHRCTVLQSNVKSTLIARKVGIDYAKGEYITFCDADDGYRAIDSIRKMVEAIEDTGADIVQFGNIVNRFGKKHIALRVHDRLTIDRTQLLREEIAGVMGGYNQKINLSVWSKIYKKEILKDISHELNIPLINAEDLYLNCCAFFSNKTQRVSFVPLCEYVYNAGIGVSGDGISSAEKMLREYQFFKTKALELARMNMVAEKPIYLCNRETLRYLDCLIQDYILNGDSKREVCNRICEWWSYSFIQAAKAYFIDYMKNNDLDEEMKIFATEENPERYYDYCVSRMGNLYVKRFKFKCKDLIKKALRIIDRL